MANDQPATRPGRQALLWVGESGRLLLGFALLALLAREVTADVLGTYLSLTSVALIAPRLLDLGLPHALGYFLRVEPRGLRSCALMLARHVALAAPVALCIAYGLRFFPFANDSVTQLTQDHWLRLALFILSELAILLGLSSFIPTGRFRAHLLTTLLPPLLFIGCVLRRPGPSLSAGQLLDLLLIASLAGSLAMMLALALASRGPARLQFPVAQAYGYGARTYGSAVSKIAAQRFDRLFLVTVLGASGYAQYSLAISIRDMAIFPANLHAMTLRNRQIDLVARGDDLPSARKILLRVSAIWLALGVVGAVAMYALWPPLVRLVFGTAFPQTADFLRIVAFSCAPMAIMGFAWNHLYAMKLPGCVTVITCASLLLAIPTFLVFIEWRGATTGVAIAVVVWSALTAGVSLAWALASRVPVSKGSTNP
jgi:O-antigen/teichoic acid export membrane protein